MIERSIYVVGASILSMIASMIAAGCSHPVLGRPAMLGASVTAGAGAATGADAFPVNAAVAYSAVVTAPHDAPLSFGDGGVAMDPCAALHEQAVAAAARRPSVVIAVDWLFWPVHQAVSLQLPEADRAAKRLASVDAALADLDRFECPIVIGDVPDMKLAVGGLLREEHDPGDAVRAEANRRLCAWAAAKPTRCILSLAALADAVNAGDALDVAGFSYRQGECSRLLQCDGLHCTPEGLAVLMAAAIDRLRDAGLVEDGVREEEMSIIALSMEREARNAAHRASPGLLETFSLSSMYSKFSKSLLANDDAGAAATLDAMLDRMESFDRNPAGDEDCFVSIGFSMTALSLELGQHPKTVAVFAEHWHRLRADALADHPHAWRFSLWLEYAQQRVIGLEQTTADLLAEHRAARGPFQEPYASLIWDAAAYLGDNRTMARCFPDLDEAYAVARKEAATRRDRWRVRKADDPFKFDDMVFAGTDLTAILPSRKAAGMPDISEEYLARARADGFGEVLAALDRRALISAGTLPYDREYQERGVGASFTTGGEVFAVADGSGRSDRGDGEGGGEGEVAAHAGLGPRVLLPKYDRAMGPPTIGFGFVEGLDGAAAVINGKSCLTVITRAEQVDGGGGTDGGGEARGAAGSGTRLARGVALEPPTATCWTELGRTRRHAWDFRTPGEGPRSVAPIPLKGGVDLAEFADAVRAAVKSAAEVMHSSSGGGELGVAWPAAVCAVGRVARATIRIPMGWDEAANAPRWAYRDISDQQVILLGALEEPAGGGGIANATLRLHAIWGPGSGSFSSIASYTGEVVSMTGFRVGSADDLSRAIADDTVAGAEVRIVWRAGQ